MACRTIMLIMQLLLWLYNLTGAKKTVLGHRKKEKSPDLDHVTSQKWPAFRGLRDHRPGWLAVARSRGEALSPSYLRCSTEGREEGLYFCFGMNLDWSLLKRKLHTWVGTTQPFSYRSRSTTQNTTILLDLGADGEDGNLTQYIPQRLYLVVYQER